MEASNQNLILGIIITLLVILFLGGLSGYGMMGYRSFGGGMMGYSTPFSMNFMWIFGFITWVLFIILLILGIIWLARQLQGGKK